MKNYNNNIFHSRFLRAFLLLLMVYFSQVSPFHLTNHFHEKSFELNSHPVDFDDNHASDHHHHDEDSPHTQNHQHSYDNQIDWHIVRTQLTQNKSFETNSIVSKRTIFIPLHNSENYRTNFKPPFIERYQHTSFITRGPPSLS